MKKNILILFALISILSCKKDKSSDEDQQFPYYFTATINGGAIKYEANDLNSQYGCGTSAPYSANGDEYDIYEGTFMEDGNDPSKNNIYVHVLKYFDHEPDLSERLAMVDVGNYPYGVSDVSSATINGVSIGYTDATGKEWFSEFGPQTGSTFSITELVDNPDDTSLMIFKATFSCKLYDGSGGSIQVSNAVIRGKLFNP
jgi:hypothetical protein